MKKLLLFSTTGIVLANLFISRAFSQNSDTCPPLYNGGIVCQEAKDFRIDKKVQDPQNGSFVDQIPENETLIDPEHTMIFRIEVTNKTTRTLSGISVRDTLPHFVSFVKADGTVKQTGDIVTYTIKSLDAGKTTTMNIQAKVLKASDLPSEGNSPLCVANQAEASSGIFSKQTAKDYATFCVTSNGQTIGSGNETQTSTATDTTKGGFPIPTQNPNMTKGGQTVYPSPNTTSNPNTGPEAIALIGLIPAALGGLILRIKSKAVSPKTN